MKTAIGIRRLAAAAINFTSGCNGPFHSGWRIFVPIHFKAGLSCPMIWRNKPTTPKAAAINPMYLVHEAVTSSGVEDWSTNSAGNAKVMGKDGIV